MASSSTATNLTPAQELAAKHAAEEAHKVTVEEVVDQEDIEHPPPSTHASSSSTPTVNSKGKEKAPTSRGPRPLDVNNDEAFPSLGPAKPVVNSTWGKKPADVAANGVKGPPSAAPGRPLTMGLTTRPAVQAASLPGHVDSIKILPGQMLPRNQLKKPLKDILMDINKRSRANITMKEANDGYLFEGRGPSAHDVRSALQEVSRSVGIEIKKEISVPAALIPHIIGKQGSVINKIREQSGARIDPPKQDAASNGDGSREVKILVTGDPTGVAIAHQAIQKIVDDNPVPANYRLDNVPAEFFPFLSRKFNSRDNVNVKIPDYYHFHTQPPPRAEEGQRPVFSSQPNHSIQVSGDQQAAQKVRAEIERQVEELRRELSVLTSTIDKPRHRFIVGERGDSHRDFLEETGCTVVLPPHHDDDDTVYIIGPASQLSAGEQKAWDSVDQMNASRVDVARQLKQAGADAAHAKALFQYLSQRQAIKELEQLHGAAIVHPSATSSAYDVYTKQDGKSAREITQDIVNVVLGHPPSRVRRVPVNPFYLPHIRSSIASQIRNDHGVFLAVPDDNEESPELVLVYEAPEPAAQYAVPRGQPSQAVAANFAQALQEAQSVIDNIIKHQASIQTQSVEAPSKFHDKIRRYVEREQSQLAQGQVPIQVLLANQQAARTAAPAGGLSIRGPSNELSEMYEKLLKYIEQEHKDEKERSYVTSCDFPQQYMKNLVGKQGSHIKELREEFDVEIDTKDKEGQVIFKGPQAKAERAKAHVLSELKKWKDETTHELTIEPHYHRELIGAKGSLVNKLQDRYNVRINFPKSNSGNETTEGAPERKQAPNKVIIRGPSDGANKARKEIDDLYKYLAEHSNTATVAVAKSQVPSLIGAGGREMDQLRQDTGAQIDVPNADAPTDASGRIEIKITGTKQEVDAAKKALLERAKVYDNTITKKLNIEKRHHRNLIGAQGANIRDIVAQAGGPDDQREATRMVRFPKPDSSETEITIQGKKDVVEKIIAAITSIVSSRESQVSEVLDIKPEKHRLLIGRGGEKRRSIESQFSVTLDIPSVQTEGEARNKVKISGQPEAVQKAKDHILSIVKEQGGETIQVPLHMHHVIADNNNFFRVLRNNHKVRVDHGGQQPPPRPASSVPRPAASGGNLPLITDDPSASESAYSWSLSEPQEIPVSDETIPWILMGNEDSVAKAKELIQSKLANAPTGGSYTGFLGLPDPRAYGSIVGPGGSKISSLRKQTGTQITVPRNGAEDPVQIVGSKEGCEKARDLILEILQSRGQRRDQ